MRSNDLQIPEKELSVGVLETNCCLGISPNAPVAWEAGRLNILFCGGIQQVHITNVSFHISCHWRTAGNVQGRDGCFEGTP